MTTYGIKVGTQPHGAVLDPSPVAVGDVRWFREGTSGDPGRLFRRKVRRATQVVVTTVLPGYVLVDYMG